MKKAASAYRQLMCALLALPVVVFAALATHALPTPDSTAGNPSPLAVVPAQTTALPAPSSAPSPFPGPATTFIKVTLQELLEIGSQRVSFVTHGSSMETMVYQIQVPRDVTIMERTTGLPLKAFVRFFNLLDSSVVIDAGPSEVASAATASKIIYLRGKQNERFALASTGILTKVDKGTTQFEPLHLTKKAIELLLKDKSSVASSSAQSPVIEYVTGLPEETSANRGGAKPEPLYDEIYIAAPASSSREQTPHEFELKLEFTIKSAHRGNKATSATDGSSNAKNAPQVPLDLHFQRPVPRQTVDGPGGPSTGTATPGATGSPSGTPGTATPRPSGTVTPGGTITPGSTASPNPSGTVTPKVTGSVTTTPAVTASSTSSPSATGNPTGTVTPDPSGTVPPNPSGTVTPGDTSRPDETGTPGPPGGTGTVTPPADPSGTIPPGVTVTGTVPPGWPGTSGPTPPPGGTVTPPVWPSPSRTVPPQPSKPPRASCDGDVINKVGPEAGCESFEQACCLTQADDPNSYACIPLYTAPVDRYGKNKYPCLNNNNNRCNSGSINGTTGICPDGQVCCYNQSRQPQCQSGYSCYKCDHNTIGQPGVCPGEQACCYDAQGAPRCQNPAACYYSQCDKSKQNLLGRAGGCEDSRYACCNESRYGQQFKCVPQGHGYPHPENGNTAPNCLPYVPGTYPPTVSPTATPTDTPTDTPRCQSCENDSRTCDDPEVFEESLGKPAWGEHQSKMPIQQVNLNGVKWCCGGSQDNSQCTAPSTCFVPCKTNAFNFDFRLGRYQKINYSAPISSYKTEAPTCTPGFIDDMFAQQGLLLHNLAIDAIALEPNASWEANITEIRKKRDEIVRHVESEQMKLPGVVTTTVYTFYKDMLFQVDLNLSDTGISAVKRNWQKIFEGSTERFKPEQLGMINDPSGAPVSLELVQGFEVSPYLNNTNRTSYPGLNFIKQNGDRSFNSFDGKFQQETKANGDITSEIFTLGTDAQGRREVEVYHSLTDPQNQIRYVRGFIDQTGQIQQHTIRYRDPAITQHRTLNAAVTEVRSFRDNPGLDTDPDYWLVETGQVCQMLQSCWDFVHQEEPARQAACEKANGAVSAMINDLREALGPTLIQPLGIGDGVDYKSPEVERVLRGWFQDVFPVDPDSRPWEEPIFEQETIECWNNSMIITPARGGVPTTFQLKGEQKQHDGTIVVYTQSASFQRTENNTKSLVSTWPLKINKQTQEIVEFHDGYGWKSPAVLNSAPINFREYRIPHAISAPVVGFVQRSELEGRWYLIQSGLNDNLRDYRGPSDRYKTGEPQLLLDTNPPAPGFWSNLARVMNNAPGIGICLRGLGYVSNKFYTGVMSYSYPNSLLVYATTQKEVRQVYSYAYSAQFNNTGPDQITSDLNNPQIFSAGMLNIVDHYVREKKYLDLLPLNGELAARQASINMQVADQDRALWLLEDAGDFGKYYATWAARTTGAESAFYSGVGLTAMIGRGAAESLPTMFVLGPLGNAAKVAAGTRLSSFATRLSPLVQRAKGWVPPNWTPKAPPAWQRVLSGASNRLVNGISRSYTPAKSLIGKTFDAADATSILGNAEVLMAGIASGDRQEIISALGDLAIDAAFGVKTAADMFKAGARLGVREVVNETEVDKPDGVEEPRNQSEPDPIPETQAQLANQASSVSPTTNLTPGERNINIIYAGVMKRSREGHAPNFFDYLGGFRSLMPRFYKDIIREGRANPSDHMVVDMAENFEVRLHKGQHRTDGSMPMLPESYLFNGAVTAHTTPGDPEVIPQRKYTRDDLMHWYPSRKGKGTNGNYLNMGMENKQASVKREYEIIKVDGTGADTKIKQARDKKTGEELTPGQLETLTNYLHHISDKGGCTLKVGSTSMPPWAILRSKNNYPDPSGPGNKPYPTLAINQCLYLEWRNHTPTDVHTLDSPANDMQMTIEGHVEGQDSTISITYDNRGKKTAETKFADIKYKDASGNAIQDDGYVKEAHLLNDLLLSDEIGRTKSFEYSGKTSGMREFKLYDQGPNAPPVFRRKDLNTTVLKRTRGVYDRVDKIKAHWDADTNPNKDPFPEFGDEVTNDEWQALSIHEVYYMKNPKTSEPTFNLGHTAELTTTARPQFVLDVDMVRAYHFRPDDKSQSIIPKLIDDGKKIEQSFFGNYYQTHPPTDPKKWSFDPATWQVLHNSLVFKGTSATPGGAALPIQVQFFPGKRRPEIVQLVNAQRTIIAALRLATFFRELSEIVEETPEFSEQQHVVVIYKDSKDIVPLTGYEHKVTPETWTSIEDLERFLEPITIDGKQHVAYLLKADFEIDLKTGKLYIANPGDLGLGDTVGPDGRYRSNEEALRHMAAQLDLLRQQVFARFLPQ